MNNNIGEARRSYGLTLPSGKFRQDEAAKALDVSLSTYKKWEQGQGKLNGEILCRIADLYGCSTDYLLCRTSIPDFHEVRFEHHLSVEEQLLVDAYRNSNAQGRATLLAVADVQPGMEEQFQDVQRRVV